jgi:hypothetical protein
VFYHEPALPDDICIRVPTEREQRVADRIGLLQSIAALTPQLVEELIIDLLIHRSLSDPGATLPPLTRGIISRLAHVRSLRCSSYRLPTGLLAALPQRLPLLTRLELVFYDRGLASSLRQLTILSQLRHLALHDYQAWSRWAPVCRSDRWTSPKRVPLPGEFQIHR